MPDSALNRNKLEKAQKHKTSIRSLQKNTNFGMGGGKNTKNYSDKNGNEVPKGIGKGRNAFTFWTVVVLLFLLAIGNLTLTFTIFAILRLGNGMECMEFLSQQNVVKFFGATDLDSIFKRDGVLEGFGDVPMTVESEGGSVNVHLQSRLPRAESKLTLNSSGVFVTGVNSVEVRNQEEEVVFSTAAPELVLPDPVNNLRAKSISTKRITSPLDSDLNIRSEQSIYLRGAEGSRLEARQMHWNADQDVFLKSLNGNVVLSGKEGVFVDVKYLPIAILTNRTDAKWSSSSVGQYKVCVCMPQGKLFRIPILSDHKVACSHVNMAPDVNPCI